MTNIYCASCRSGCMNNGTSPIPRDTGSYIITLDSAESVLHPAEGQAQRFCYQVAVNPNIEVFAPPLDYVILGIPGNITAADFDSLTVMINGVNQPVSWGVNTFIVTQDVGTICSGLKLVFPLTNATDVMYICFSLKNVYAVNTISACFLEAGQGSVSQTVLGPVIQQSSECPTTTYQEVDVCVPVSIAPYATVGEVQVNCCGEPTVTQGTASCAGTVGGTCAFTISQRVCIAVPVVFGASAVVGNYAVNCGTAASGTCENCGVAQVNGSTGFSTAGQTFLRDVISGGTRRCNQ